MAIINFPKRRFQIPWRLHNITVFIVAANVGVFFLSMLRQDLVGTYLAMNPLHVLEMGHFWTPLTYAFLHTAPMHLVFNMLALFFIGYEVERHMGSWHYLIFYLVVALGAGLLSLATYVLTGAWGTWLLGASGVVYGLLLAYACFFPERQLLVFGIFPVRAPYLVLGYAALDIIMELSSMMRGVAHLTHLYGMALAFLIMLLVYRINYFSTLRKP